MYSQILIDPLASAFNHILTGGTMPPSRKYASIIVLPQRDRDALNVKSYRLFIFTSLLAKRLGCIIGFYINQDQMGFIPNWDIVDNVYHTLDIIHHCKRSKMVLQPYFHLMLKKLLTVWRRHTSKPSWNIWLLAPVSLRRLGLFTRI